jgi:hypothetical protein
MIRALAAGLGIVVALSASMTAQQPPAPQSQAQRPQYLTPEQLAKIRELPALPDDRRVQTDGIDQLLADGKVLFLDVRERKEIEDLGTLEGYVNIPLLELESRLNELPKDKAILTA